MESLEKEFWDRVNKFRWIFQISPHIYWVGVCNSLAMHNIKKGSDIDILIVSKKEKLFTCRLWITVLLSIFGVRRHGTKTHKRFCLSFFIEESYEDLNEISIKDDIYLARWIKTLQPIAGNWQGYETFLKENQAWIKSLVGKAKKQKKHFHERKKWQTFISFMLAMTTMPFEKILKKWQIQRGWKKMAKLKDSSGTIINAHMLKFHDNDIRHKYREKWKKSL